MKTLVFSQCRVVHDIHGRLLRTCLELVQRLNPGIDVLLIDNASPLSLQPYLTGTPYGWAGLQLPDEGYTPAHSTILTAHHTVAVFNSAIGHFNHDRHREPPPRDGPGRAISTALSIAMASGYERAAYIEGDCLCFRPVSWGFDYMARIRRPRYDPVSFNLTREPDITKPVPLAVAPTVGFQPRLPVGYLDNNVWLFSDLRWLANVRAVERYDWPNRKGDFRGEPTGEQIWERIFADDLSVIPWRGGRAGMCGFDAGNLRERFPDGIDYITHADRAGYCAALSMMGHSDLAPYLMGD